MNSDHQDLEEEADTTVVPAPGAPRAEVHKAALERAGTDPVVNVRPTRNPDAAVVVAEVHSEEEVKAAAEVDAAVEVRPPQVLRLLQDPVPTLRRGSFLSSLSRLHLDIDYADLMTTLSLPF